jgi:hypothetical protein
MSDRPALAMAERGPSSFSNGNKVMAQPQFASPSVSTLLRLPTDSRFSALEWSVVAVAEREDLEALSVPGRIARAFASLFPKPDAEGEGDPRLEALRRITILIHRFRDAVPLAEIRRFLAAGFSMPQYVTLARSLGVGERS